MRKLRVLSLALCLIFCAGICFAQSTNPGKITGTLADSTTAKPVPYVTVALKDGDKLITGTTSEDNGTFVLANIPLGTYSMVLSYVGYRTRTIPVTLTSDRPVQDLGKLQIASEAKALSEITVSGQKDLVEDKGDRLVYNAEKDISNAGGTAADVLRKVPMLSVDLNGNVQMRGNSNIKVLINGKPSAMMARNLADALRQMPANTIKTVEVITNPGARYDAEGSAGVINIITKKALQGINGSVNATAGNFNQGVGTSLNVKKGKFGLALSANGHQQRFVRESASVRTALFNGQPLNILTQTQNADNTGLGGNGEMSLDFDPDSTSRINVAMNIWGGNFPNDNRVINVLTDPAGAELQAFGNDIRFYNPFGNGQMDVGYTKTFKKPGQEFSLLGQFSRMPDNYFYNTDRFALSEGGTILSRQHSANYSRNKEYTVQTDYTHPFTRKGRKDTTDIKLEVGVKTILRDIGSEFRVEESLDGVSPLVPVPALSNDFDYVQQVYSGYTSFRLDTKRKWGLSVGTRLEHTDIDGDFVTTGTSLSTNYTNLIPSFTLSKGIKSHTVKISYTQRIQRPLIWYLNPWVNEADTLNKFTGNPYLDPELSHSPELSYSVTTKKGVSVNSSLYYRLTDNAIEYLTTVDAKGVALTKPLNIARRESYGFNMNLSGQPNKDWNMNGGADIQYINLNSPALNQQNSGTIWSVNLNTTYKLPKDFSLQANGNYNSGWVNLQGKYTGFYWYGFSAKREFWNKKASLTLGVFNPFNRGVRQEGRQLTPTFRSDFTGLFVTRSARLTFEWRFGQMDASGGGKRSKKISNDDKGGR
jgi:outer membrane receptor for ferrienterochelin and colicin